MEGSTIMDGFKGILIFILLLLLYVLPSFMAWNKKNVNLIISINVFLGWTVIGWLVALGLALTKDEPEKSVGSLVQLKSEDDKFDKIKRLKELLDRGALTQEEFNKEKQKLLDDLTTEWKVKD